MTLKIFRSLPDFASLTDGPRCPAAIASVTNREEENNWRDIISRNSGGCVLVRIVSTTDSSLA